MHTEADGCPFSSASMAVEQMDSPYEYPNTHRPPSIAQEREAQRPKHLSSEYPEMDEQRQNAIPHSTSYQLPKPSAMHPRYIAPDSQRYPATSSHENPTSSRLFGDQVRPPSFASPYQPVNQFGGQRLGDDFGGGGMYASATSTASRTTYDSRSPYGLQSSQGGSSSHSGPQGQLPWGQSAHPTSQSSFSTLSSDPHQSASFYQSSVSPVIPTGGMPFPRSAGAGQSRTAGQSGDEGYDGRTRNAKAQKRHREKRKAHVKHVSQIAASCMMTLIQD